MTDQEIRAQLELRERPEDTSPVMKQRWDRLLFLHWHADPDELSARLPPGLRIQLFDDKAWIAVVPFFMRKIRPAKLCTVPWLSNFLELNVRTYVVDENGVSGVWFFSLDTDRWIARTLARRLFHLPYFWASMSARVEEISAWTRFHCSRFSQAGGDEGKTSSHFDYRALGPTRSAEPGSLEFFLLERYLLYSWNPRLGKLYRGRVWHPPYRFRDVEVPVWDSEPIAWNRLTAPSGEPVHQCYVDRVEVDAHPVQEIQ